MAIEVEAISFTCPPIPGGGGNGLLLQPNFRTFGPWNSSGPNPVVNCVFVGSDGTTYNPATLTTTGQPPSEWNATFNVPAGTRGMLKATIKVNNVVTVQNQLTNLQVVASGGGTCT